MFGRLKTSIDTTKIRNIKDVKRIVKYYVKKKMWDKASHLLKDIKIHEKENANKSEKEPEKDRNKMSRYHRMKTRENL